MTNEVISLSPGRDLREFFTFLYGDQTGYVYAPTKHSKNIDDKGRPIFEQQAFEYPGELNLLIKYCMSATAEWEVYIGPALYKSRAKAGKKEDVKGTYVFWTEFDGTVPPAEALGDLPAPSWRVQSSEEGHEHFYWKLDYFEIDVSQIERANRGLTYQLGGDTSAWDANQVLRPVSTYNHKRQKPVVTLAKSENTSGAGLFSTIPIPPQVVSNIDTSKIPDALEVIATHKFEKEVFTFFRKSDIPVGSRSAAMMRLGYYCAEMGLSDVEAFALLYNADERWGKFKNRSDRERRLLDIINKARIKFPLGVGTSEGSEEAFPEFNYIDFLAADIRVEWFIDGLLQRAGYLLLSGPPATGKTQLTLQWAIHLALGRSFLGYSANKPAKIIMFSMEMGHADLKYFVEQMDEGLTEADRQNLAQNLIFIPTGTGIMLDDKTEQAKVERLLEKHHPDGCIFDSLGLAATDDLSNESIVKSIMKWNADIRAKYDCFTWFIHHNRKAQAQNKKPNKLEDVYGSLYITSNATTVLGLWPRGSDIEVSGLKIRLAPQLPPFIVSRTPNLNFSKVDITFATGSEPVPEGPVAEVESDDKVNLNDI